MPTKILVLETPTFQLGANAGPDTEKLSPMAFSGRLQKHRESGAKESLFVIAPEEVRFNGIFSEANHGPGNLSFALFSRVEDCIRFLPSLPLFYGDTRTTGLKDCLQKGSTIYSTSLFNGKNVGSKLDPAYAFARRCLSLGQSANAWGCMQSLVIHGLQFLPDLGESGTGEKVDVQVGSDSKHFALTVRFDVPAEKVAMVRSSPILNLPRTSTGVFESRFVAEAGKMEFNCLFFRENGPERTVEISSFLSLGTLEDAGSVSTYQFKGFENLDGAVPEDKRKVSGKGGFKKKFSAQIDPEALKKAEEESTRIAASAPEPEKKVVVSGSATLTAADTVVKAGSANAEIEAKVKNLEAGLKVKDEMIAKLQRDLSVQLDPSNKRDVITNIKDTQSEGLKQNLKLVEAELEEAKSREKELMKMVDKAVQMKDEAAKKIKELEVKLKQAGGQKGSKEQMLEKQIEEQKRQNKELSNRVTDLMNKLQAAGKRAA